MSRTRDIPRTLQQGNCHSPLPLLMSGYHIYMIQKKCKIYQWNSTKVIYYISINNFDNYLK